MAGHGEREPSNAAARNAPRVLVVEDNGLIAAKLAQILRRAGHAVVGPAATLVAALDLRRQHGAALGAALLDIDLRGEPVYPLAQALEATGVPFLFLTGYESLAIPEAWRGVPRIEKPFEATALLGALARLLAGAPLPPDPPVSSPAPLSELDHRAFAAMRRTRELFMERYILREESGTAPKW